MWTGDTIEWIDIELTSYCNIDCPGCFRQVKRKKVNNILITGGGCRNIHLMNRLKEKLKISFIYERQLRSNFDYIESELIAYLSARSIYKLPFTFPSTTGVSKPLSGGKLYQYS